MIRVVGGTLAMVAAAIALVWLTSGRVNEVPASGPERTERHPNGLVVQVPVDAGMRRTPEGFELVDGEDTRLPRRARLIWEPRACDVVAPVVREQGAGAGGTQYEMVTRRPVVGGCLSLVAREQIEIGRPDFGFGLRAFQTARMERQGRFLKHGTRSVA